MTFLKHLFKNLFITITIVSIVYIVSFSFSDDLVPTFWWFINMINIFLGLPAGIILSIIFAINKRGDKKIKIDGIEEKQKESIEEKQTQKGVRILLYALVGAFVGFLFSVGYYLIAISINPNNFGGDDGDNFFIFIGSIIISFFLIWGMIIAIIKNRRSN